MENPPWGLVIRQVSKTYRTNRFPTGTSRTGRHRTDGPAGGVHALHQVSLEIPPGLFGLLGPNGAGKSTLMRTLATLQEPDEGQLFLGDIDIVHQKAAVRQTLGYLPQEFGVYPKSSAEELLDYFAVLKGITHRAARRETTAALLKQTNLWDQRKQKLGGYSGGMRQRFGVAVALLGNPRLLIVDEPTAGLDPAERVRFLNLLSELGERSVVILSTHLVADVAELCTNMAIINRGQILLKARPQDARGALKGRIWRQVIEQTAFPALAQEHRIISAKRLSGRTLVHVYSPQRPCNGFEAVEPELEDVYFSALAGCIGPTHQQPTSEGIVR
ncbi:ABC-type multidrug transport system, ATPase component [Catalinimonas alkaloidigena]|uniref:ABC-type multidrug transport system, ATPase component n=1 Tax=Catalinimonas alkaloidigena TaxID=1075417 RepID=A0A1G9UWC2_9BACT|nr:ABC transporter ATP-binding protein [Catalinimonas alkaloidigena]SDM64242.1 ABC-type multidrug transport system, ATPase component [Catalinimonas alkaloidigena]